MKEPVTAEISPEAPARYPSRALTSEELNAVTSSGDFLDFVEKSSKVIEKALDQDYDVLADYGLDGVEGYNEEEDEGYASSKGRKGRRMKEVTQFYDERWSKKRMISDLGFSPKVGTFYISRKRETNLLLLVPGTSAGILHQESIRTTRPVWSRPDLEHAPPFTPRIYLSRNIRRPHSSLLTFSPFTDPWWLLQWTSVTVGHTIEIAPTCAKDTADRIYIRRSYPPSVFYFRRWHSKR